MSARNPLHRTTSQQHDETPVVLPHVVIAVTENGALDVTVDGTPFPPPAADSEWTRGTFGPLLDVVTKDRTIAVRIEVREVDGTVFTDLIRARKPTPPPPDDDPVAPETRWARRAKHTKQHESSPVLVEVTGEGFVPGEDIAVAVIVSHTDAADTGAARALLDKRQLDAVLPKTDGAGEVVLYGRISGTIAVRRVP
ncbi:hypothetical protein M1C57_14465 [Rhodococcus pyridinivorans]|uniref:hypothetical protein n=1 Tax=Rhodococcus pyridinivorans TaxID=103816 RepID=UPI00200B0675|nr:hypothetical protein [Rhodococcus pyridinivorans]UPW02901.1 hypothetical protein M1C57_14465 [Rhodococcus pyridinivorans]